MYVFIDLFLTLALSSVFSSPIVNYAIGQKLAEVSLIIKPLILVVTINSFVVCILMTFCENRQHRGVSRENAAVSV